MPNPKSEILNSKQAINSKYKTLKKCFGQGDFESGICLGIESLVFRVFINFLLTVDFKVERENASTT